MYKRYFLRVLFTLSISIGISFGVSESLLAQDDLQNDSGDSEFMELADRFLDGVRLFDEASVYQVIGSQDATVTIEVDVPDLPGSAQLRVARRDIDIIFDRRSGDENISQQIIIEEEITDFTTQQSVAYTIEADIRYIDDVFFVNAVYNGENATQVAFPEGWVRVNNPANWPIFSVLDLQSLAVEEDVFKLWLADPDYFYDSIVSIESLETDDGDEIITVEFDFALLVEGRMASTLGPAWPLDEEETLDNLRNNDAVYIMSLGFNEDGIPNAQMNEMSFNLHEVDYTEFTGDVRAPENTTISYTYLNTMDVTIDRINDPDIPIVEEPEIEN